MVSVSDVSADKIIEVVRTDLKNEIKMPEWALFVKTGPNRQRPPQQEDWWWTRAASVLRKVYLDGPVGINRLRTWYGGKKDRGVRPERTMKSGGKIVREILNQLEELGYVKKNKKGRGITPKGQSYMDAAAKKVMSGGKDTT